MAVSVRALDQRRVADHPLRAEHLGGRRVTVLEDGDDFTEPSVLVQCQCCGREYVVPVIELL